ncbi:hypothetical protein POG22_21925, partial [Geitlerinema sp. CS-897]|nr:hypothetical protein [Geitlerinema sp. CS-897]
FSDREAQKPWIFVGDYRFNWEARVQNDHWASCTASEFALETYSASPKEVSKSLAAFDRELAIAISLEQFFIQPFSSNFKIANWGW